MNFYGMMLPVCGIHPSLSPPLAKPGSVFASETLGVIAQLVERLNGIEEVWGSNPHGSTKRSWRDFSSGE
jgi:hypothetical protein